MKVSTSKRLRCCQATDLCNNVPVWPVRKIVQLNSCLQALYDLLFCKNMIWKLARATWNKRKTMRIACYGLCNGATKSDHGQTPVLQFLGLQNCHILFCESEAEVSCSIQSKKFEVKTKLTNSQHLQESAEPQLRSATLWSPKESPVVMRKYMSGLHNSNHRSTVKHVLGPASSFRHPVLRATVCMSEPRHRKSHHIGPRPKPAPRSMLWAETESKPT